MIDCVKNLTLSLILSGSIHALAIDGNHLHYSYEQEGLSFEFAFYIDAESRADLISSITRHRMMGEWRGSAPDASANIDAQIKKRIEELGRISDDFVVYSQLRPSKFKKLSPLIKISEGRGVRSEPEEPKTASKIIATISEIAALLEKQEYIAGLKRLALFTGIIEHQTDKGVADKYKWLKETYFDAGILRLPSTGNHAPLTIKPTVKNSERDIEHYLLNVCIAYKTESCVRHYALIAVMALIDAKMLSEFKVLARLLARSDSNLGEYARNRLTTSEKFQSLRDMCSHEEMCSEVITQLSALVPLRYGISSQDFMKLFSLQLTELLQNKQPSIGKPL